MNALIQDHGKQSIHCEKDATYSNMPIQGRNNSFYNIHTGQHYANLDPWGTLARQM